MNCRIAGEWLWGGGLTEGLQLDAYQLPALKRDPAQVAAVAEGGKFEPIASQPAPAQVAITHQAQAAEHSALIEKLQILAVQVLARQRGCVATQVGVVGPGSRECGNGKEEEEHRGRHKVPL